MNTDAPETTDAPGSKTVRVLEPLWIANKLFKAGETASLPTQEADVFCASGHVEII